MCAPLPAQASTARRKRELRPSDARRIAAKMGRRTEVLLFMLNAANLIATVLVGSPRPCLCDGGLHPTSTPLNKGNTTLYTFLPKRSSAPA